MWGFGFPLFSVLFDTRPDVMPTVITPAPVGTVEVFSLVVVSLSVYSGCVFTVSSDLYFIG